MVGHSARRLIALALTVVPSGCMTWETTVGMPAEYLAANTPRRVRITRTDGTTTTVDFAVVRNDSIVAPQLTSPIALMNVAGLERRRLDLSRTIVTVLGIPSGALVLHMFYAESAKVANFVNNVLIVACFVVGGDCGE